MKVRVLLPICIVVLAASLFVTYRQGGLGAVKGTSGASTHMWVQEFPGGLLNRKFLLDWEVGSEGADFLQNAIREIQPAWLMTGEEAAAERIIRDTVLGDIPDELAGAVKKTFSPRMKVIGDILWTGDRAFKFSGTILFTYGNGEGSLDFSFDMRIERVGLLPLQYIRDKGLRQFAGEFVRRVSEALEATGKEVPLQ